MSDDQGASFSMMESHLNFGFRLRVLPKLFVFFCIPWVYRQCVEETYLHVYSLSRLSHEQPISFIIPARPCLFPGSAYPVITNTCLCLISSYLLSLEWKQGETPRSNAKKKKTPGLYESL